jgi:hypothetical protein
VLVEVAGRLIHILAHRLEPAPLAPVVAVVVLGTAGRLVNILAQKLGLPAPPATVVADVVLGPAAAAVALLLAGLAVDVVVGVGLEAARPCRMEQHVSSKL